MQFEFGKFDEVDVIWVKEPRLTYPLLGTFSAHVSELIENGTRKLIVDLSETRDLDAASYGCLMDFYRMLSEGTVKLTGVEASGCPVSCFPLHASGTRCRVPNQEGASSELSMIGCS